MWDKLIEFFKEAAKRTEEMSTSEFETIEALLDVLHKFEHPQYQRFWNAWAGVTIEPPEPYLS